MENEKRWNVIVENGNIFFIKGNERMNFCSYSWNFFNGKEAIEERVNQAKQLGIGPASERVRLLTELKRQLDPNDEVKLQPLLHEEMEILTDPNLFTKITKEELDKKIVGEQNARKTIFLAACVSFVENSEPTSSNLLVHAHSGAGKDHVTANTLEIFSDEEGEGILIKRTRISPTAFTYWDNMDWNGKIFYNEDISNNVLNSGVFKTMSSGGSHATVVVKQKIKDIKIEGKPAMIITTASVNPSREMLRCFPIILLDETVEQTNAIIQRRLENAEEGLTSEYSDDIRLALGKLKKVRVRIPFAKMLSKYIPKEHIIMRTNSGRFLDFIKASAALHQFQRGVDEEGFVLAEGQDYDIARNAILAMASNVNMIPLTKEQEKILGILKEAPLKCFSVCDLESKVTMSDRWLRKQLNFLTEEGFFVTNSEKRDDSFKPVTVYRFKELAELKLPTWKEINEANELESGKSQKVSEEEGGHSIASPNSITFLTSNDSITKEVITTCH